MEPESENAGSDADAPDLESLDLGLDCDGDDLFDEDDYDWSPR